MTQETALEEVKRLAWALAITKESGYCVRCRGRKKVCVPELIQMKNGRWMVKGACVDCKCSLYRILPAWWQPAKMEPGIYAVHHSGAVFHYRALCAVHAEEMYVTNFEPSPEVRPEATRLDDEYILTVNDEDNAFKDLQDPDGKLRVPCSKWMELVPIGGYVCGSEW